MKKNITEEMKIHKEWYELAKKQTLETLPEFLRHLMEDYGHDYGTICHVLSSGAIAAAYALNSHEQGGITGFQAGAVMWEFIRHWNYTSNKTGMRIIDYDNMLYPQYEEKFEKTISESIWAALQAQAAVNLRENTQAHPAVIAHWNSIVSGIIPFGFEVKPE